MTAYDDADERTSLIRTDSRPPSYDSRRDRQTESPEPQPLNKVSKADLVWILLGLWSAVFLGALDGECACTHDILHGARL